MINTLKYLFVFVVIVGGAVLALFSIIDLPKEDAHVSQTQDESYKHIAYTIDEESVELGTSTAYFGNEVVIDLNHDGKDDRVFLIVNNSAGSGVFYYAVAAIATEHGYEGSRAYFLGDRIAPQATDISKNPAHKDVIVVNFAERAPNEPMTASPSIAKSVYLKWDEASNQFGVVENNFEGEASSEQMTLTMKKWMWQEATNATGERILPRRPEVFSLTFKTDGTVGISTDCNGAGGSYRASGGMLGITEVFSTMMYCEGSQEQEYLALVQEVTSYGYTEKGALVLTLRGGKGSMLFK
jgi:heat shock protein HslJ